MFPSLDLWREQCKELVLVQRNDLNVGFHFHSPIEICYVQEGELEVYINDQHTVLRQGELSISLSYDSHCYHTVSDHSQALVLIIPTHLCPDFLALIKNQRATASFIRDAEITAKIMACYGELQACHGNTVKSIGYVNVILGTIIESMGFDTARTEAQIHLSSRIILYIDQNFQKDITLTSIAAALGYNPSYLSRYFNACFHIGISQYITLIRLKQFIILSRDREKSIADCAFACGFRSLRTFYRAFYKEFHCSPKDFIA